MLSIVEFADNDHLFEVTKMTSFFVNKNFHSRMSFKSDTTAYKITRERFQTVKAENITDTMINVLVFMRKNVKKSKVVMFAQINKHRKSVKYSIENEI